MQPLIVAITESYLNRFDFSSHVKEVLIEMRTTYPKPPLSWSVGGERGFWLKRVPCTHQYLVDQ
jgi:hypothetical protein